MKKLEVKVEVELAGIKTSFKMGRGTGRVKLALVKRIWELY
ncbi:MAG TPA: hypothetical protein VK590_05995 [Saprospiraceae bacterium]|nr:hypothetical protein [Saprospiraceae bacterium]